MNEKHTIIKFITWRFYLVICVILFFVAGLLYRVIDLAILDSKFLRHEGDSRIVRVINEPSFRGNITDRNGFPLAVSTVVYSIWINPKEFSPHPESAAILGKLLEINKNKFPNSLTTTHKDFIYLKRGVSPEIADKIKSLALPGVYLQEEYKRFYPEGEIAAHVVGFTNIDDKGQEGLELSYNQWLTGNGGKKIVIKDRRGRVISDVKMLQEQKTGNDLKLSIDRRIQYIAYQALAEGVVENQATAGSVIVLDTKTGEILAMVNQPSFNPNNRVGSTIESFRNRAVTDVFEPGSTIKSFSIAHALNSGKYTANSLIETAPGWMRVGRNLVRDEHNNGLLTLTQILQFSSNVGTAKIVLSLPPDDLWAMLHNVGFGETTGSGFPGERSGSLVKPNRWSQIGIANLAYGYGISVTPLQLAIAYSVLANHGLKIPVSILKTEQIPDGSRVMRAKIADEMLAMLETVTTTKRATGELARIPGYRVAGKTGTAVMVGAGGYEKHHYTSSFIGIAPVSNPRLIVAVIIHDPTGKHYYGATVSAPIFQKIMTASLRILNIPPDDLASLPQKS